MFGVRALDRRRFFRSLALLPAVGLLSSEVSVSPLRAASSNPLPRWRGFNLLDFFSPDPDSPYPKTTDQDLRWMADWGFDFVRLPMAYPRYLDFDGSRPITPAEVYEIDEAKVRQIADLVYRAQDQDLHVSINLHRAPGYCVNAGFHEPYNLWTDPEALKAFAFHWGMWAERFRDLEPSQISFDLVNEPSMRDDMNDQHGRRRPVPGELYRKVAAAAAGAIWAANPGHQVIADGNDVGQSPIEEISDMDIGQSCRGYFPHYISHYRAPWVFEDPDDAPRPQWPGEMGGESFGREDLEEFYRPWIDLVETGVGVHCGECGCWKETPHEVFLAWFEDILDILTPHGIGYALWNFRGSFGILDSGRSDVDYEDWYGHKLDRKLLDLLMRY